MRQKVICVYDQRAHEAPQPNPNEVSINLLDNANLVKETELDLWKWANQNSSSAAWSIINTLI